MYFETGQGSEFTYGKHDGIDMTTTEALCYGLARRYDPFMVNNVTGFIGPETHRDDFEMILANLQDHFMGKLLGLPMGMAPCYTLHSEITLEGQQIATQLLAAAGANYYMDVYLTTDRMLAYFDTSGHDDQTLREVHGLEPAPQFLAWALERGIFARDEDGTVVRGPAGATSAGSAPPTATSPAGRSDCPRPTASRTRDRDPRTPSRGRCGRTSRSHGRRSAPTSTRNGWATSPSRGSPPQRRTARRTSPTPARARACRPMRSPRCHRARTTSSSSSPTG